MNNISNIPEDRLNLKSKRFLILFKDYSENKLKAKFEYNNRNYLK
jgi:hypothetical protein